MVALGRAGGKKTAQRGGYFKQIAAMRKTRAGGTATQERQYSLGFTRRGGCRAVILLFCIHGRGHRDNIPEQFGLHGWR